MQRIIESPKESYATKEFAVQTLIQQIQTPEVIEYALENEEEFRFGKPDLDEETDERYRTAIYELYREYANKDNWMLMPYIFKSFTAQDTYGGGLIELEILCSWLRKYNSSWLLYEFMLANSNSKSEKFFEDEIVKNHFEYLKKSKE